MNGGDLQKKVQFITYTKASDGAGGWENINPVTLLTTWCRARQIKASRTAENLQEGINAVYELKLRMRANFNPQSNYTVKFDNNEHNITEVVQDLKDRAFWLITVVHRGTGL